MSRTYEHFAPEPDADELAEIQQRQWEEATAPHASELVVYPPGRTDYRPKGAVLGKSDDTFPFPTR